MTRTLRLFLLGLLVCSASVNAEAQYYLYWQHADGRRVVWTMEGTTRVRGELIDTSVVADPLTDPLWKVVADGDFLFQHQGDGRLAGWRVYCGYPYGTFELSPSQVPDLNWKVRGYAYFNDHFLYLMWQNEMTGQIAAWKMGGDGTIRLDGRLLTPSEVPDTNWRIVGIADFNWDGHSDLVWQHQTSGLISVWYMKGLTRTAGELLSPGQVLDTNWKIRAVADVNEDYHPDLIWQHQTTGLIAAWLMKGLQRVDGLLLSPDRITDTNWRIVGTGWRDPWECWY